ncbi:MAG: cytochrome c [Spirosomataceae bacterium]
MIRNFIVSLLLAVSVSSCLYVKDPTPTTSTNGNPCSTTSSSTTGGIPATAGQACFDTQIKPIFAANCAMSGCHDAITKEEGYDLSSYSKIISKGISAGKATSSKIYQVINANGGDRMPPSPRSKLTATEISLLAQWINEGAKNTICQTTSSSGSLDNVTFAANIKPIIDGNCVGCHGRGLNSGNINLESYAAIKIVANNGKLYGSITYSSGYKGMPQGGKLTDCEIATIKKWIDNGALNN